jgi:tetratricopeptide (TPR) repeat protein
LHKERILVKRDIFTRKAGITMSMKRFFSFLVFFLIFLFTVSQPTYSQESEQEEAILALCQQVAELHHEGRYTEAISVTKRILAMLERAFGPEDLTVAVSLNKLAALYIDFGDYADAEPLYKRSLAIREKALGPDHPDVASTLNNLALLYRDLGDYAKAEPLLNRSLGIDEKTYGPNHPEMATDLSNLAAIYYSLGNYAKAEGLCKRSLAIREKALSPDHPDVANSLSNLADIYKALGDYADAEPLYKRSLAIREKALGPHHPDVATSMNNLAELYRALGDYANAEPLLKRSLDIREKALGPDHHDVANTLNNLAMLYHSSGDYTKAEPLYKRALEIDEKAYGPNHADVAAALNNLAALYHFLGDYAKAEALYKRSLTIREKALGPDHPDVANSMNNLAELYRLLGDYANAEPLYKRALEIDEKAYGPDHPDVANSMNNLAELYRALGNYPNAELLYKRSLTIREKALGPDHPYVATSLNSMAGLYYELGDYPNAEPLLKRALDIREKALGPDHPDVATSLNNLAVLFDNLRGYDKAAPLFKRSLDIREKALGPDHPDVANSVINLALLYTDLDDFEKAHDLLMRGLLIDEKLIDQVMGFTSEEQKLQFLSMQKQSLYAFLSLIDQYLSDNPIVRKDALNVWLKRKGVILEAQKRFQDALVYSDDPQAIETFQELSAIRAQLSKLAFSGPGKEGSAAYKKKVSDLDKEKERLEGRLSQLSQAFSLKQKIAKADCEKVAKALPEDTALIEFARVEMFNFKAKGKEKAWNPAHYLAFVLHSCKGESVGLIDLGDAEEIDKAVAGFKMDISNAGDIEGIKASQSSKKIYDLVFAPIKKELGPVKEIFISPDGNLNLIPFEVLQGPEGRFLIEDYTFNYLAAGRDVLGFGQIKEQGENPLLMGDPDFDMGTQERDSVLRKLALREAEDTGIVNRSSEMRGLHFSRLPGTGEEVRSIKTIIGEDRIELYTGKEALEEVLRQRGAPSILHLATHGFFLGDQEVSDLAGEGFDRGLLQTTMLPQPTGKKVKIENPLLRSGIALAGANNALSSGGTEKSGGIVTAEKILGLRLRGTDMVVLSACETGVGEVKTGEGVFGLRRAFTQAGTKSLVMSMWAVPDKETKELMVEFYENIRSGKMDRCQALRQAALKQMQIVKERYGHANPLFWGAFVFMGQP